MNRFRVQMVAYELLISAGSLLLIFLVLWGLREVSGAISSVAFWALTSWWIWGLAVLIVYFWARSWWGAILAGALGLIAAVVLGYFAGWVFFLAQLAVVFGGPVLLYLQARRSWSMWRAV